MKQETEVVVFLSNENVAVKLFRRRNITESCEDMKRNIIRSENKGILMKLPKVKLSKGLECYLQQGFKRACFTRCADAILNGKASIWDAERHKSHAKSSSGVI
jgi:hypothetical protein